MTQRTVTTQSELDAALLAPTGWADLVIIKSEPGVWLEVGGSAGAYGSATVRAYDSATVDAYGSATVRASGSATVRAYGSATVDAYGSATVRAYDSATVHAYDSATVHAYGSATVRAYDSATVHAYDSATVRASDSATVRAGKFVAVHLHTATATVEGGVVIDCQPLHNTSEATAWVAVHQAETAGDGTATVYKAVNAKLRSQHDFDYPIGATVEAPDWRQTDECGNGLHFGATPHHASLYYDQPDVRFLACRITLADAVGITDSVGAPKIKAKSCVVLHEVDVHGRLITAAVPA
jgi:hypothetical protein